MHPLKHGRKSSTRSLKLLQTDYEVDHQKHENGSKTRLKNAYNGLVTSKELLKVMRRLCCFHHQNETLSSLFAALAFELDRTYSLIVSLLRAQKADSQLEIDLVFSQLKQQNRIQAELDTEKKLRRQSERLNARLGQELADAKASLSKTVKELDDERAAREMLEQMCDEFARGINEDRAEAERMKKKSEKAREEMEKEREMFRLADVLREERVRMKMLEAKHLFEETNAAMDELRNEFQKSRRRELNSDRCSPRHEKIVELEKYLRETLPKFHHGKCEEDDSDLHSIELNADDDLDSQQDEPKSESRKIAEPVSSTGKKKKKAENVVVEDDEEEYLGKKDTEEMERYKMIKDLRDHVITVSGGQLLLADDDDGGDGDHGDDDDDDQLASSSKNLNGNNRGSVACHG